MKHNLSACIVTPTLAVLHAWLDCVSPQLFVSVFFIAVPTNTAKFFLKLEIINVQY